MKAEGLSIIAAASLWVLTLAHPGLGVTHLWTFDEGEGVQAHDEGGDRAGIVSGARWVQGRIGDGLWFDGEDDYVALPTNNPVWLPVGDFTVSFWVWFDRDAGLSVDESEVLVDLNHASSSQPSYELGYQLQRRGGEGRLSFQMTTMEDTDEDLYSETVPVKGRWYHLVAVRDGTLQAIYVDGELDASRRCSSTAIDFVGGLDDDKVNVGRYTNTDGWPRYHFKGTIDELMLLDRALTPTEVRRLYRDGAAGDWHVDGTRGSDRNDGTCSRRAFATIRKAIETAVDGDVIDIHPGVYRESIRFMGKAVTVRSSGDAAILESPDGAAVSFDMDEGPGSVLRNVIIRNSRTGISYGRRSTPTVTNVTITGSQFAVSRSAATLSRDPRPVISNSILWDNRVNVPDGFDLRYCCVLLEWYNEWPSAEFGNFSEDPLFIDPANGDYHLRSEHGRYWPEHDVWVVDDLTSPCVDAGDPAADISGERTPNGGRLNVGAHGGTAYAERSDRPFWGDVNGDEAFDNADYVLFMQLWEQRRQSATPSTPGRR